MLQLTSHSFWAKSSSEAILEHLAGAQSLSIHVEKEQPLTHCVVHVNKCSKGMKIVTPRLHTVHPFVREQVVTEQHEAGTLKALA